MNKLGQKGSQTPAGPRLRLKGNGCWSGIRVWGVNCHNSPWKTWMGEYDAGSTVQAWRARHGLV
jgi:hypothetical protein